MLYASLLGGSETSDSGNAITLDGKGGVYIAGTRLYGPGFPTTPGSYQHTSPKTVSGGLKSGTVSKVDFGSLTVCQPLIAPTTLNVSPQGGIANFTLTVAAGCPWELNTDSGITITGEKTGMGSNSPIALSGTVLPNDSTYSSRTLLAHIGTATLTVMQQQASCSVPVFNPTSLSFDSSGGIRNVTVTLPHRAHWQPPLERRGCPLKMPVPGALYGTKTLSLYAAPNSFGTRTTSLSVNGAVFWLLRWVVAAATQ